jgi:hypothetical protein
VVGRKPRPAFRSFRAADEVEQLHVFVQAGEPEQAERPAAGQQRSVERRPSREIAVEEGGPHRTEVAPAPEREQLQMSEEVSDVELGRAERTVVQVDETHVVAEQDLLLVERMRMRDLSRRFHRSFIQQR